MDTLQIYGFKRNIKGGMGGLSMVLFVLKSSKYFNGYQLER